MIEQAPSNPLFSVVITAYNKGAHIASTIQSVLDQSFADFEVIIVDDGSTDNTRSIVSSFVDARIRSIHQPHSGLPACARNKGISCATGRFIALLDGDDLWTKEKLARCKAAFDEDPAVGLVYHNLTVLHNEIPVRNISFGTVVNDMYDKLLLSGNCLGPSAVVFRREFFSERHIKFNEGKEFFTIEDYDFWLQLSKVCRFRLIPEVLAYYRITETGAFLGNAETSSQNMLRLLTTHFAKLENPTLTQRYRMRKRISSVMCAAGRMHHHHRHYADAQRWYRKALKEFPLNYRAAAAYLLSLIRVRIIYK